MIKLYKNVDFDNTYKHTFYKDKDSQTAYFSSRLVATFDDTIFFRKNFEVRVNLSYEQCCNLGINYCIVNNGSKDYYYFVISKQYINDEVTELTLELDVLQTYLYDVRINKCFVEREHVDHDEIGRHILPESIAIGDYIINDILQPNDLNLLTKVLAVNGLQVAGQNPTGGFAEGHNFVTNGIKCDKQYVGYRENDNIKALETLNRAGQLQYVSDLFYYPTVLLNFENEVLTPDQWELGNRVTGGNAVQWNCGQPSLLDGYRPHNNKLYTYPYCYAEMITATGFSTIYKYEYFKDQNVAFQLQGACSEDTVVQAVPKQYRGYSFNINEMSEFSSYPHIPVTTDNFDNYLARKSTSMMASATAGVLSSIATGGASAFNTLAGAVSDLMMMSNHNVVASTISGDMTGIITKYYNNTGFRLLKKSITNECARMIDNYFDAYGYRVDTVKVPQLYTRTRCNYVKTRDCTVTGNIDIEDILKIENIFNAGVTLWHDEESLKWRIYGNNEVITE